jgi:hypothetical protein
MQTQPSAPTCPVFNAYLEVAIDRQGRSGHTETIEGAFLQVMKGHTGLMAKILSFETDFLLCSIPIVVTTAELCRADYDIADVPLKTGKIDHSKISVAAIEFCAVNFHANDEFSLNSRYVSTSRGSITEDLANWKRRTIFVVQAQNISDFLKWLRIIAPAITR